MDEVIEKNFIGAVIDVGKNVAEDIIRPTSKSIGDNLGLMVDGVMGWLGYWGKNKESNETYIYRTIKLKLRNRYSKFQKII